MLSISIVCKSMTLRRSNCAHETCPDRKWLDGAACDNPRARLGPRDWERYSLREMPTGPSMIWQLNFPAMMRQSTSQSQTPALRNIEACAVARVPLVEGTTGWQNEETQMRQIIGEHDGALIYGANFSVGANLFYRAVEHAASLFAVAPEYGSFIEEAHHAKKRDAPSGTALRLRDLLSRQLKKEIPIASTRAGHIPGTHRVGFDSAADQITLTHTARSRQGFASGALVAAEWIVGRKGVYEFSEVIDELVGGNDE